MKIRFYSSCLTGEKREVLRFLPFLALVVDSLPADEINDTLQFVFDANGNLYSSSLDPELGPNLINNSPWVCTRPAMRKC